ncbi:MAG: matrixin family metalloprotease [Actinomycetia bacterium]|nr:matrixin family metalloprotease [Actinomycetes bacterium]
MSIRRDTTFDGREDVQVVQKGLAAAGAGVLLMGFLPIGLGAQAGNSDFATIDVEGNPVRWNPCQAEITVQANVKKAANKKDGKKAQKKAKKKALKEVKKATEKLKKSTGLPLKYNGKTKHVPTGQDWPDAQGNSGEIVVAYATRKGKYASNLFTSSGDAGHGGISYTLWGTPTKHAIDRGYALLDAKKALKLKRGFKSGASRGNLLLHEMGHAVGLGHASDPGQLMHPNLSHATPRGFSDHDQAGLDAVGAKQGCIKVPAYAAR